MNYKANIVVATYNRLELTKQSLPSFIETASSTIPYMISVVDNGSKDGTQEYLKELFKQKKIDNLLLLSENIGISKAHNIMWKLYDDIDFYGKVDNDMLFKKQNWLDELVNVLQNSPELGVAGYLCNHQPQHHIHSNNSVSYRLSHGNIGGACYFIPRRTHKLLGFWCEKYGPYGEEDADYSLRVFNSNMKNAYMVDMDTMVNMPEHWEDYLQEKAVSKRYNLSGVFQQNMIDYCNKKNLHQDSTQFEIYKDQIMSNI
jgi:glycosyltransferase involved in cell wall biosynthesis